MKKVYEAPSVEKIAFRYRDQIVAASGDPVESAGGGNIFQSNQYNDCYDLGDVGKYMLQSWLGDCEWIA